jgi:hypothetical protein
MKIRPVWSRVVPCERTNLTKLIAHFAVFANAPKNESYGNRMEDGALIYWAQSRGQLWSSVCLVLNGQVCEVWGLSLLGHQLLLSEVGVLSYYRCSMYL